MQGIQKAVAVMECPECGSEDVEPIEFDDEEDPQICFFVCEACGHEFEEDV